MNKVKSRIALVICLIGVLFFASSCMDDDNIIPLEFAYVSLYNVSPDAPDLGIIVDNQRINNNPFDYADYTGYLRFYTGSRNLRFSPFGADNVVVDTTLEFKDKEAYSIFVVDAYQHADVLVIKDEGQPAQGQAMIRFLNLSPDAAAVNLVADGVSDPLFADQAFKETSEFKAVDAKTYDFTVTSADGSQSLLTLPDTQLFQGHYYTILVRGYQTPPAGNNHVLSSEVIVE